MPPLAAHRTGFFNAQWLDGDSRVIQVDELTRHTSTMHLRR